MTFLYCFHLACIQVNKIHQYATQYKLRALGQLWKLAVGQLVVTCKNYLINLGFCIFCSWRKIELPPKWGRAVNLELAEEEEAAWSVPRRRSVVVPPERLSSNWMPLDQEPAEQENRNMNVALGRVASISSSRFWAIQWAWEMYGAFPTCATTTEEVGNLKVYKIIFIWSEKDKIPIDGGRTQISRSFIWVLNAIKRV